MSPGKQVKGNNSQNRNKTVLDSRLQSVIQWGLYAEYKLTGGRGFSFTFTENAAGDLNQ